jgi:glycosyltransferase involved in cell wall biosynthesis
VFHGYLSASATRLAVILERRAAKWCDRLIVLTDRGREEHLAMGVGRSDQFVTIPSGIDPERFEDLSERREYARAEFRIPDGSRVVGCVARLVKIKGIRYLVEAMEELVRQDPALRLLLVGDGEERASLESRIASGPLRARAILTGALPNPSMALAAMDVFVLPSLNEGQGRAVVEAMAAGIPVVASDVGGLPEVLDEGAAGILVPPASPAALAAAVWRLFTEPETARSLAGAARRRIHGRYDRESMVAAVERLYLELLASRERP